MFTRYAKIESILAEPVAALAVVSLAQGPLQFRELADTVVERSGAEPSDPTLARALARLVSSGTVWRVDQGGGHFYALTSSGERLASDITLVAGALAVSG